MPTTELEPAGDPALAVVAPANAAMLVVEAPAVAVHQPAARIRDQLAERRHPILQRHSGVNLAADDVATARTPDYAGGSTKSMYEPSTVACESRPSIAAS